MRKLWIVPSAAALALLVVAILLSQGATQAQAPMADDLVVTKTVDKEIIEPGEAVAYSVILSNTTGVTLELTSLVDTLPDDFAYMGLTDTGLGCKNHPPMSVLPKVQWGPISVPPNDEYVICYSVSVSEDTPLSGTPYKNSVVATLDSTPYSAEVGVKVAIGEVTIDKTAAPAQMEPGEPVTYAITFNNSGFVTEPLAVVTDMLPAGMSFTAMTSDSDVQASPSSATGTIVWTGPFTIPADSDYVFEYLTATPLEGDNLTLDNTAYGELGDGSVISDSASIEVSAPHSTTVFLPYVTRGYLPPLFAAFKEADPPTVFQEGEGALVTYEVEVKNYGTETGVLASVKDQLPAGFTFVKMLAGSSVMSAPSGTTGLIVWNGPFNVNAQESFILRYEVRTGSALGSFTNTATPVVSEGYLIGDPAEASVEVKEPYLLIEEFENPDPLWEPFLNYWRLHDEQWWYANGASNDGSRALKHAKDKGVADPDRGAHDAMFNYLNPAAEDWTNYSFQTSLNLVSGEQIGVWFRGTVDTEGQLPGRRVTGYYFLLIPGGDKRMRVELVQMRTDDECGDDCNYNYHWSNPISIEEVKGAENLKGVKISENTWYRVQIDVEGPRIRCYVNNVLLVDYYDDFGTTFNEGSVGFFAYQAWDARFDHVSVKRLP